MRNQRSKLAPLDPAETLNTRIPFANRLGMPCIACGSPVDLDQVYCPGCLTTILRGCRQSMHMEELERELAEVA